MQNEPEATVFITKIFESREMQIIMMRVIMLHRGSERLDRSSGGGRRSGDLGSFGSSGSGYT